MASLAQLRELYDKARPASHQKWTADDWDNWAHSSYAAFPALEELIRALEDWLECVVEHDTCPIQFDSDLPCTCGAKERLARLAAARKALEEA